MFDKSWHVFGLIGVAIVSAVALIAGNAGPVSIAAETPADAGKSLAGQSGDGDFLDFNAWVEEGEAETGMDEAQPEETRARPASAKAPAAAAAAAAPSAPSAPPASAGSGERRVTARYIPQDSEDKLARDISAALRRAGKP